MPANHGKFVVIGDRHGVGSVVELQFGGHGVGSVLELPFGDRWGAGIGLAFRAEFGRTLACGRRIETYMLRLARKTMGAAVIENVVERVGGCVRSKAWDGGSSSRTCGWLETK
jgi:hypothetical protein